MKFSSVIIDKWRAAAKAALAEGVTLEDVVTGQSAWNVAHKAGICTEAYRDREVIDAHIQTALEKIFPNAVFLDKKRY